MQHAARTHSTQNGRDLVLTSTRSGVASTEQRGGLLLQEVSHNGDRHRDGDRRRDRDCQPACPGDFPRVFAEDALLLTIALVAKKLILHFIFTAFLLIRV